MSSPHVDRHQQDSDDEIEPEVLDTEEEGGIGGEIG